MMTSEEYLERISKESYFGRWIRKNPDYMQMMEKIQDDCADKFGIPALKGSLFPGFGKSSSLTSLMYDIIPYFPIRFRSEFEIIPIGYVYERYPNGFAKNAPDGGAIICISQVLQTLLQSTNTALMKAVHQRYLAGHRGEVDNQVTTYACGTAFHYCSAILEQCIPPMNAAPLSEFAHAWEYTEIQMKFSIAHELSHIVLGHVYNEPKNKEENHERELASDKLASEVILSYYQDRLVFDRGNTEKLLGAIGALFYAGKALIDLYKLKKTVVNRHPTPEERFQIVIDVFREELRDKNLMGEELLVHPYGLLSAITIKFKEGYWMTLCIIADIYRACIEFGDYSEATYFLDICYNLASKCNADKAKSEISILRQRLRTEQNCQTNWAIDPSWPI
jgi:hypothetical protein